MKLDIESGLWCTGRAPESIPLVAVLELSGAVLSWVVDAPAGPPEITFTDPAAADWLWQLVGESGHVELLAALHDRTETGTAELPGVTVLPGSADRLRRLAIGHWLRRWWPASDRDGIAALDPALLDAEIALLTVAAQDFFSDDTFDSDVAGLLRPHAAALRGYATIGDPRIAELAASCAELAEETGIGGWAEQPATPAGRKQDDYALAAGPGGRVTSPGAIAHGVATIHWTAVPPGIFDAADGTVAWTVREADGSVNIVVAAALSGAQPATGIPVSVHSGAFEATGVLDAGGRATLLLTGADSAPMTESQAWNHGWPDTAVTVGVPGVTEAAAIRDRVRAFARARLTTPTAEVFLAEILAAESDY